MESTPRHKDFRYHQTQFAPAPPFHIPELNALSPHLPAARYPMQARCFGPLRPSDARPPAIVRQRQLGDSTALLGLHVGG